MPVAIAAEQRALQESIRRWAANAGTITTVRSQSPPSATNQLLPEPGLDGGEPWTRHWADLARLGIFSIAVPEHAGGAGGSALDVAAGLEALADALVPGPVLSTVLGALLLAPHADAPAVKGVLPALATGAASVAVAVPPVGGPVLDAGSTTHLLVPIGPTWVLLEADHPDVRVSARAPVDFSRSLGDLALGDVVVGADHIVPVERVRDTAAMLFAVEAAAVAGWALRTATEYAKVRHQFGRPIGSFQAVKHLCAGMLCRSESAAAAAWDAACAYDEAPDEFPLAAAVAAAVALDAAVDNAKDCVQVLGGIGFTWEHDAHLYLRRALALRQLLGGSAAWRERTASLVLAGRRRSHAVRPNPTDEAEPPDRPRPDAAIAGWAVPTIEKFGTDAQRERFVGPSTRGEIRWCQLFSEPEAGSDLAGLRTRAVRVDGGWRLTGQKVWTSLAATADYAICLARTDFGAPKHKGLTYFLVAMRDPGIDIRPLREITGRSFFNEVFLDDVFVPDDRVVGAPGDGWRIARATLAHERVAMGRGSALGDEVEALVRVAGHGADSVVRQRIGALVASGLTVSRLDLRTTLTRQPESAAVAKLVGVAHRQAVAETALDLLGAEGAASSEAVQQFLLTRCLSIAGGTTQILLSVAAERVLGLPREER